MKNIVHQNSDGSISVTFMAPGYVQQCYAQGMIDQQILDKEAAKVIPSDATRLPDHDTSELPDASFQAAWKFDVATQKVVMDTAKQTNMQWQRVRSQRDALLDSSDVILKSQQAKANSGKPNNLAGWQSYQQALRDIPEIQTDPFNIVWPTKPALS